jgi:preprotein translocase subunit SecA
MGVLARVFSFNERELARYRQVVDEINLLEPRMRGLSDEALAQMTVSLKSRLADGETLDDALPDAYATVREAARRVLGERPFDVQLMGAIALHDGRIAEMKTGEGKTLTATMPLYLNALLGRGAHLVTTNDYLVRWQAQWMGQVYQFLGLTVGFIQHDMAPWVRAEMYACDVTYVQNSELGFDYLKDNMALEREQLVLRDLYYAIVDEVDSILIDEARTPLILSGVPEESTELYRHVDSVIARLAAGYKDEDKTEHGDYVVDEKLRTVNLTEVGQGKVEKALGVSNLAEEGALEVQHHVQAALKAHTLFHRDKEYIVKDGEVIIVDEFTGHLQPGRRYSDGIHQAIEAKEGVAVRQEQRTVATITYQNFFRLYEKLAGMTGTAKTEEAEFQRIYNMPVIVVPTNKPVARSDSPDVVYKTQEAKFRGIVSDIVTRKTLGQPTLVGTRNVDVSELIARRLLRDRVQLLALVAVLQDEIVRRKDLSREDRAQWTEALRVPLDEKLPTGTPEFTLEQEDDGEDDESGRDSGRADRVLTQGTAAKIARALDITPDATHPENLERLLDIWRIAPENASPEERSELAARLAEVLQEDKAINPLNAKFHAQEAQVIREAGKAGMVTIATNMAGRGVDIRLGGEPDEGEDRSAEYARVKEFGGLHVIGTERHESRRIDNQLRGRSGRQGDPGSSRFYVSLEDELMRIFAPERMRFLTGGWPEEEPVETRFISKTIERAQHKVEMRNFGMRKHTLQYDNVMNEQRSVIYANRRRVLMGEDVQDSITNMIDRVLSGVADGHANPDMAPEEWDLEGACTAIRDAVPGLVERLATRALRAAIADQFADRLADTLLELLAEERRLLDRLIERTVLQCAKEHEQAGAGASIEQLLAQVDALVPGAAERIPAAELAELETGELGDELVARVREMRRDGSGGEDKLARELASTARGLSLPAGAADGPDMPDVMPACETAVEALTQARTQLLEGALQELRAAALRDDLKKPLLQACSERLQAVQKQPGPPERIARDVLQRAIAGALLTRARSLYEEERQWHERAVERRLQDVVKTHADPEAPMEKWDIEGLRRDLDQVVPAVSEGLTEEALRGTEPEDLAAVVTEIGRNADRSRDEAQVAQRLEGLADRIATAVRTATPANVPLEEWDIEEFFNRAGEAEGEMRSALAQEALRRVRNSRLPAELKDPAAEAYAQRANAVAGPWGLRRRFAVDTLRAVPAGQLAEELKRDALELHEEREQVLGADSMRRLERGALLRAIEASWPQHLQDMDHLRDAIHLRAYGQLDPLVQYQKESYEYFQRLLDRIAQDVTKLAYGADFVPQPVQRRVRRPAAPAQAAEPEKPEKKPKADEKPRKARQKKRRPKKLPKPNRSCWCGSGKKYKDCHMDVDMKEVPDKAGAVR